MAFPLDGIIEQLKHVYDLQVIKPHIVNDILRQATSIILEINKFYSAGNHELSTAYIDEKAKNILIDIDKLKHAHDPL